MIRDDPDYCIFRIDVYDKIRLDKIIDSQNKRRKRVKFNYLKKQGKEHLIDEKHIDVVYDLIYQDDDYCYIEITTEMYSLLKKSILDIQKIREFNRLNRLIVEGKTDNDICPRSRRPLPDIHVLNRSEIRQLKRLMS